MSFPSSSEGLTEGAITRANNLMKAKHLRRALGRNQQDRLLQGIMLKCGGYFGSGKLFYQRLWRDWLIRLGFRVISIEKLDCHHLWELKLCGTLTAQSNLLLSIPVPAKSLNKPELLELQLQSAIRDIASELGPPIKRDEITVARTGAYFKVILIWPRGEPGLLLRKEKRPDAFRFLIRPWLRTVRN